MPVHPVSAFHLSFPLPYMGRQKGRLPEASLLSVHVLNFYRLKKELPIQQLCFQREFPYLYRSFLQQIIRLFSGNSFYPFHSSTLQRCFFVGIHGPVTLKILATVSLLSRSHFLFVITNTGNWQAADSARQKHRLLASGWHLPFPICHAACVPKWVRFCSSHMIQSSIPLYTPFHIPSAFVSQTTRLHFRSSSLHIS